MLGSVLCAAFALWFFTGSPSETLYGAARRALVVVYTHRENIARLRAGTERPDPALDNAEVTGPAPRSGP